MKLCFTWMAWMLVACSQTGRQRNSASGKEGIKTVYLETKNFGSDLQVCFAHTIIDKWTDSSFRIYDSTLSFRRQGKQRFHDIGSFKVNGEGITEKMVIRLNGDPTVRHTTYSIERFVWQDGNWKLLLRTGPIKTFDRPNDFISPGKMDVDEICEQLVQSTVACSYE